MSLVSDVLSLMSGLWSKVSDVCWFMLGLTPELWPEKISHYKLVISGLAWPAAFLLLSVRSARNGIFMSRPEPGSQAARQVTLPPLLLDYHFVLNNKPAKCRAVQSSAGMIIVCVWSIWSPP